MELETEEQFFDRMRELAREIDSNQRDYVASNRCYAESGYDFFEQQVREEFEEYARRQGYDITRNREYSFFYADGRTEDAWRMYHQAHVRGREFQIKRIEASLNTRLVGHEG